MTARHRAPEPPGMTYDKLITVLAQHISRQIILRADLAEEIEDLDLVMTLGQREELEAAITAIIPAVPPADLAAARAFAARRPSGHWRDTPHKLSRRERKFWEVPRPPPQAPTD